MTLRAIIILKWLLAAAAWALFATAICVSIFGLSDMAWAFAILGTTAAAFGGAAWLWQISEEQS